MSLDWILQKKETHRLYSNATWVPLRAVKTNEQGHVYKVGYESDFFGCGSIAVPIEFKEQAENLSWNDIGIVETKPYAYRNGQYSPVDQYEYHDNEPIGLHLVFDYSLPVLGGNIWMLNPDLIMALRIVKEGNSWVRPEENFVEVVREFYDSQGEPNLIEIKREYLIDYLAARNLSLRLSYYKQRVINVASLENSQFSGLADHHEEQRDGGRFQLRVCSNNDVFGGKWAMFRTWRTDIDEDEDAPVMGPENESNTAYEKKEGNHSGYEGTRIEGEFWRDEWIEHHGLSKRVRGDDDPNLPHFIIETDGTRLASSKLNKEDIGRWLWFRSSIVNELLSFRGFSIEWFTSETGALISASQKSVHFGINAADLITVYACDIARLDGWEQHVWAAHNVVPDGKVSSELLAAQVKAMPAETYAVEFLFFEVMKMLEDIFKERLGIALFSHDIDINEAKKNILRFVSRDQASLLRLAKEIVRYFSDRLNVRELRKISMHPDKEKLGSNKLLQNILSQKVGEEKAREIFGPIVGAYDMRLGDAHPTSSKIGDALRLAGVEDDISYLRKGERLISNVGQSIWFIGKYINE
ncbi:hypothetical protein ACFF2L_003548 [Enterobacter kobei]